VETFDVIIVLGTRVTVDGRPSPSMARRMASALDLVRTGLAGDLLLSGGSVGSRPAEAIVMREMAVAGGVPVARLAVEDRSRSTVENAIGCAAVMAGRGWRRALIVSDGYHLPRALLAFRLAGIEATGAAARLGPREPVRIAITVRLREVLAWLRTMQRLWIADRRRLAAARRAMQRSHAVGEEIG